MPGSKLLKCKEASLVLTSLIHRLPRMSIFIAVFDTQSFFFFNDTATTEIYTLSLHDALPISRDRSGKTNERGHHSPSLVNFVPNIWKWKLNPAGKGVEDDDNHLALARNTMACHVEQFPTGTYERAHRYGPGSTIILLDGSGFSMMWPNELGTMPFKDRKDSQVRLAEWKEGTLLVPPLQWYHQHFDNGKVPARFVKLGGWNYDLYPFTTTLGSDPGRSGIDYPNEDPRIRQIFMDRLAATGAQFKMPESVFKKHGTG